MNAKESVTETIKNAFGSDFIGISDNKIYVKVGDEQVAISLTIPKKKMAIKENTMDYNNGIDFDNENAIVKEDTPEEATAAEKAYIAKLLKEFGIN